MSKVILAGAIGLLLAACTTIDEPALEAELARQSTSQIQNAAARDACGGNTRC